MRYRLIYPLKTKHRKGLGPFQRQSWLPATPFLRVCVLQHLVRLRHPVRLMQRRPVPLMLRKSGTIMWGKTTMSRSGNTGKVWNSVSFMRFPLWQEGPGPVPAAPGPPHMGHDLGYSGAGFNSLRAGSLPEWRCPWVGASEHSAF